MQMAMRGNKKKMYPEMQMATRGDKKMYPEMQMATRGD